MREEHHSSTAIGAAMLRAAHLLWDSPPRIFADTFALALSGATGEAELRHRFDAYTADLAARGGPGLAQAVLRMNRSNLTMRSRYVEDGLAEALRGGLTQYAILGAGLDSFAWRRPDLMQGLRVFEVDHPATQAWKQARLRELGVATPPNLVFVPVDFLQQSMIERLRISGYRRDAAGYFSWLGVVSYLTHDAIFETLRSVAALAAGTEIRLSYFPPTATLDQESREVRELLMASTAARGEPMITAFEPAQLVDQVRALGFAQVWDFGPEEANARYFAKRTDGLRVRSCHILGARV